MFSLVSSKDGQIEQLGNQIDVLNASYDGKIDKQIIKNLIISYFATPHDKRSEGERLLARFLDFNQQEMDRAGIRIGKSIPKAPLNDSFTSKFVEFLESESEPDKGMPLNPPITHSQADLRSMSDLQAVELARDLNKRLNLIDNNQLNGSRLPVNPFVSHSSNVHFSASHQSQVSTKPTVESLNNQLLCQNVVSNNLIKPLFYVPDDDNPSLAPDLANISDIVRDAVEKEKIV